MIKLVLIVAALVMLWMYLRRPGAKGPVLDAAEARAVLGVDAGADAAAIRAAHRRLVTAVHPDRGGSAELTRRVNRARDVLLATARD